MKKILLILILSACFSFNFAAIIYVDHQATGNGTGTSWLNACTTISDGITIATSGDEIWVAEGTYYEAIELKSSVSVYGGFNGTELERWQRNWTTNTTIIDGTGNYNVVTMDSLTNSAIDGFTITGGSATGGGSYSGGGIYCYNLDNTSTIANNTITTNSAWYGGGIACESYSSPLIQSNIIRGNTASYRAGGLFCSDNCSPIVQYNTIQTNSAWDGAGIACENNSSPIMQNNTITGNTATYNGGAIYCSNSSPTIQFSIIADNQAGYGGGIYCSSSSSPTIANNAITGNSAVTYHGGGIYCHSSSPHVQYNTISVNSANVLGGGIFCQFYSWPNISHNAICGNRAGYDGGGIACLEDSSPVIANNVVTGNHADYGAGISCYWHSSPSITNNTIYGNSADISGGGIFCQFSCFPTIKNNIFSANNRFDIYEYSTTSDPLTTYNDFYNNPDGLYFDEGTTTYTLVTTMDANIGECSDNMSSNPLFVGNTFITGTWTADATYDSSTFLSTLTDDTASWIPNSLVGIGKLINPNIFQVKQYVPVSNTARTIKVWGDLTSVVQAGDNYRLLDYHLQNIFQGYSGDSPCIDAGDPTGAPATDFEGEPRPGSDGVVDIGADEAPPEAGPVIPSPTPTGTPTCVPIPVATWEFEPPPEGWSYKTAAPPSDIPGWAHASSVQLTSPSAIGISTSAGETTDYYGSWDNYSGNPDIPAIAWVDNSVWRAIYTMSTDQSDPNTVPSIRLRFVQNHMKATSYIQCYPGDWVPLAQAGVDTNDFRLYLWPPIADNGFFLAFDLIDFRPAPYGIPNHGAVYLEEVVVDRFDLTDPCFDNYWIDVKSYSGTGLHSWIHSSAFVPYLTDVDSYTTMTDGLQQATTMVQTRAFGAWTNQADEVDITTSPQLYRATWTLACNNSTQVATIRMRMHTGDFRYASYMAIERAADPASSALPPSYGKDYYLYADLPGIPTVDKFLLAWDLYDFDYAAYGWAKLTDVTVSRRDLP